MEGIMSIEDFFFFRHFYNRNRNRSDIYAENKWDIIHMSMETVPLIFLFHSFDAGQCIWLEYNLQEVLDQ